MVDEVSRPKSEGIRTERGSAGSWIQAGRVEDLPGTFEINLASGVTALGSGDRGRPRPHVALEVICDEKIPVGYRVRARAPAVPVRADFHYLKASID
jgi:hypothetical protein